MMEGIATAFLYQHCAFQAQIPSFLKVCDCLFGRIETLDEQTKTGFKLISP